MILILMNFAKNPQDFAILLANIFAMWTYLEAIKIFSN